MLNKMEPGMSRLEQIDEWRFTHEEALVHRKPRMQCEVNCMAFVSSFTSTAEAKRGVLN
jgi:hypothetical protein